jgi:tetraacyldisaccharide 4'-kinase
MNLLQSLILPPLSVIYSAVTRTRLAAYRRGWLSVSKIPAPVISIGNLTAGGTGKTPLVEWVCRTLAAAGCAGKICVLTRGYGRENPNSQVLVSDGSQLLANPIQSGDEPYLLAKNLLGKAAVIANPDRLSAGSWAIEHLGSQVFVLDDGFQHLTLHRDLDIVTIDATNPFGGGGLRRESRSGLSRAGCVVITRTEQVEDTTQLKHELSRRIASTPVFLSQMIASEIRTLDGAPIEKSSLSSQKFAAFCGVGNPESFFNQLRREGYAPGFTRKFADHHNYTQADVDRLVKEAQARDETVLVTTAKDALKLTNLSFGLPCYVLDIQIAIAEADQLTKLIRKAAKQKQ